MPNQAVTDAIFDIRRLTRELDGKLSQLEGYLELRAEAYTTDAVLYFDGGAKPGYAYGSYRIGDGDIQRVRHGSGYTSNQAEYLTLLSGLRALETYVTPLNHTLTIVGDSKIVLNHLTGEWVCRDVKLIPLRAQALRLLSAYSVWDAVWVPREQIVTIFGH